MLKDQAWSLLGQLYCSILCFYTREIIVPQLSLHFRKDIEVLACAQSRAARLVKGPENMEWLKELCLFNLEEAWGELITLYNCLKGCCSVMGVGLFQRACSERTRGNGLLLRQGRFISDIRKKIWEVVRYWNSLPRGVVEPQIQDGSGSGTGWCGLVVMRLWWYCWVNSWILWS